MHLHRGSSSACHLEYHSDERQLDHRRALQSLPATGLSSGLKLVSVLLMKDAYLWEQSPHEDEAERAEHDEN